MRAPGTNATPKGSVTRNSFVSLPTGPISNAIASFWPDARWPSAAVKQTWLVPILEDCAVGFLAQYLVQGEKIICIVSAGAACADGTGGFVDACWADACDPTVRASAAIASLP